jgi:hypothetical protein
LPLISRKSTLLVSRKSTLLAPLAMIALVATIAQPSSAAAITDPAGDFIPSYTGPHNGDLDVLNAQVFFDGSSFSFTSTQNGAIGTTPGAVYVWGINRGAGTAGFPDIAPGVTFDSVFIIDPSGTSTIRDLTNGSAVNISNVTVSGDMLSATVPLSDLPSKGLAPANYMVNLWPRSSATGTEAVISDFAPDNSDAAVTATSAAPEPASLSLLVIGALGGFCFVRRRMTAVCK